jgi:hypothetical protein
MISTVTVSTVSTVTTASLAGSVALIGIVVLFGMLLQKEITASSSNPRLQRLSQVLDIVIAPLLVSFLLIIVSQLVGVLQ